MGAPPSRGLASPCRSLRLLFDSIGREWTLWYCAHLEVWAHNGSVGIAETPSKIRQHIFCYRTGQYLCRSIAGKLQVNSAGVWCDLLLLGLVFDPGWQDQDLP